MNCLVEFLMDDYQKKLIEMIQNREETFEQALESYKLLFIKELVHCVGRNLGNIVDLKKEDEGCLCRCKDVHCIHIDACRHFYKTICEIDEAEIERFFDSIIICYMSWIDGKATRALEAFESLLREYKLIFQEKDELRINDVSKRVLFRARLSDSFLSKLEIFHVPFNKRYNIRNERFSLTGQPVLYLGNSIVDLIEELNVDSSDFEQLNKLRVASFEFGGEVRIFDLRCNIFHDLKHSCSPTFTAKKFYRNILALICSFQKRRELVEYAFTEEYVIPQMLAQVLKQNDYEGVCYYSTKAFENYHVEFNSDRLLKTELNMAYRENYAIFTHMNGKFDYDKVLRDNLEISMPVSLRNIRVCGEDDLNDLLNTFWVKAEEAKKIQQEEGKSEEELREGQNIVENYIHAESIVKFYNYVFHNLKYGNMEYSKTNLGRVQIQLLLGILNRLLVSDINTKEAEIKSKPKQNNVDKRNEEVVLCDINGKERESKIYREVHKKGELHKAYLGFVCSQEYLIIEKGSINGAFYGHNRKTLSNEEYNFVEGNEEVKTVGSFFYRSYEVVPTSDLYGSFIENNFELVEILMINVSEEKVSNCVRMELKKIENDFLNSYDSLHPLLKQAFPILLEYLSRLNDTKSKG